VSQIVTVTALAVQAGVPALWWGPPGTGKSSAMAALAVALDLPIEVVIASIREPSDFGGLPAIHKDGVSFVPPAWAKRLAESGRGIAFFDEISTAAPAVQAGLLRVILDRVVGDLTLPATVAMVGAANPTEMAAGGWDLAAPLANRFWHGTWKLDVGDWVQGLLSGFPAPSVPRLKESWDVVEPLTRAGVGAFVRHRPTLLLQVPEDAAAAGKAWPSPRTWTMAARLLAAAKAAGYDDMSDVSMSAVAGCVGPGNATELLAWLKDADLPDPEEILKAPEKFKMPQRSDRQFAVLASVAAAVVSNATPERWMAVWKLLAKAVDGNAKDVAAAATVSLLRLAAKRTDLPLPTAEAKAFIPLLKAAGMMAS
jgi:hypothetical protein